MPRVTYIWTSLGGIEEGESFSVISWMREKIFFAKIPVNLVTFCPLLSFLMLECWLARTALKMRIIKYKQHIFNCCTHNKSDNKQTKQKLNVYLINQHSSLNLVNEGFWKSLTRERGNIGDFHILFFSIHLQHVSF